jgi:hypothetical protein
MELEEFKCIKKIPNYLVHYYVMSFPSPLPLAFLCISFKCFLLLSTIVKYSSSNFEGTTRNKRVLS